ncbi:MAG: DNA mismatch repair endonuclease MutL [Candidatus Zipacnadales bacterium]
MGNIRILDDGTANRIAAGEVVERPASVVKELVENAIDAGATRITVELGEGGKRLIRVTDDGCGMDADDAVLCLHRFATSKIAVTEDLAEIATLGFRGEALPSIAAVSRLRLTTRQPQAEEGTEVTVHGGVIVDIRAVGCPPGTMVEVRDLFFNTPARLKFLKVTNTERTHCIEWVQRLAMAHPNISFRVIHDGSTSFVSSARGEILSVLTSMYGNASVREFIPVSYDSPDISLRGYISTPRLTRANRTHQHFFVNGRLVRSRMMSHALTTAYGALLPTGRQPICAITIEMLPRLVDPNAHPTKIEVRFSRPWELHHLIEQTVVNALREAKLMGEAQLTDRSAGALTISSADSFRRLRPNPFADQIDERDEGLDVHGEPLISVHTQVTLPVPAASLYRLEEARILGQLWNTYILAEAPEALLLISQHRASEVMVAARLREQDRRRTGRSQRLVVPLSMELSPRESTTIEVNLELLLRLGYEIEPFGKNSWLIRGIPTFLEGGNYEEVLRGLIEQMADEDLPADLDHRFEAAIAVASCRAAVKAGERLQQQEMEALLRALIEVGSPGFCPHGDPVIIAFPFGELNRRFER